ncbi:MAG: winged helix-turn-helix transcriptional regulator [Candidatus Microthrix sp.]|nr:winged helix-turn-helix transcriptional regulator [Candidatus Microthrix sp.]
MVELVDRRSGPDPDAAAASTPNDATPNDPAWAVLTALARREPPLRAVLVLVGGTRLGELEGRDDLFADFCLTPFHPAEAAARLAHLLATSAPAGPAVLLSGASDDASELVNYGPLLLNTQSYQARIAGRTLDLTYMEYELLAFLAQNPDRVHSREVLLSRVWGYDYYGGARTVDVHIRRLRSKLGEEHARMIQTVRSVGYRFGRSEPGPER